MFKKIVLLVIVALLLSLAVATWFISARNMVQWIAYDDLSMMMMTIGGCLLLRGIKRRSNKLLFWAGFVLAANVFVRLPSLLGLWLGTAIPLYWWLKKGNMKASLPFCCWCWGGMASGVGAVCLLFVVMRQPLVDLDFYKMAQSEGHVIGAMLSRMAGDYGNLGKGTLVALLITVGLGAAIAWVRNWWATLAAAVLPWIPMAITAGGRQHRRGG